MQEKNKAIVKKREIDWDGIHLKMKKLQDEVNHLQNISHEKTKLILKERAEKLAKTQEVLDATLENIEVLEFCVGSEQYGLETQYIHRVCPLNDLTSLPNTPAHVVGIINMHGKVIPVFDLKKIFNLPSKNPSSVDQVVVININEFVFGLLSENVKGLIRVDKKDIQLGLPTLSESQEDYLMGVTSSQTILIDPFKLINDRNILINNEI